MASAAPSLSVPPATTVAPVYVFAAESVKVPAVADEFVSVRPPPGCSSPSVSVTAHVIVVLRSALLIVAVGAPE